MLCCHAVSVFVVVVVLLDKKKQQQKHLCHTLNLPVYMQPQEQGWWDYQLLRQYSCFSIVRKPSDQLSKDVSYIERTDCSFPSHMPDFFLSVWSWSYWKHFLYCLLLSYKRTVGKTFQQDRVNIKSSHLCLLTSRNHDLGDWTSLSNFVLDIHTINLLRTTSCLVLKQHSPAPLEKLWVSVSWCSSPDIDEES